MKQNKKTTIFGWRGSVTWLFMNLPFAVFVCFLFVLIIFSKHSETKKLRKIDELSTQVNEARWRYMDVKQEVMYGATQSQVEEKVASMNLKRLNKAHGFIADAK